eukprot:1141358-Pelagomonas_calceolata.AAC.8
MGSRECDMQQANKTVSFSNRHERAAQASPALGSSSISFAEVHHITSQRSIAALTKPGQTQGSPQVLWTCAGLGPRASLGAHPTKRPATDSKGVEKQAIFDALFQGCSMKSQTFNFS